MTSKITDVGSGRRRHRLPPRRLDPVPPGRRDGVDGGDPASPTASRPLARVGRIDGPVELARTGTRPGPAGTGRGRQTYRLLVLGDLVILAALPLGAAPAPRTAFATLVLCFLATQGAYRHRFSLQLGDEIPRVVLALLAPAGLFGVLVGAWPPVKPVLESLPLVALGMIGWRAAISIALRRSRLRGHHVEPVIIVGAGLVGQRVVRHLGEHLEYGLVPVGYVDDSPLSPGQRLLGSVDHLAEVARTHGVRKVIIAFGSAREVDLVGPLRTCEELKIEVWAIPRFFEVGLGNHKDEVWGLPLVRLRSPALRTAQWRLKRVFDTVLSAAALLVLAPVFGLIALAVKLTSPGPVFFRQQRIGQRGRPFGVLKFRTMLTNDDDATTWNVTGDDRITSVGRVLRPLSLDELPQLVNVLRGDMSLVGPRPERPHFVREFSREIPGYGDRHRVPVGLTGLAQVNGLRGDTSIEERSIFDNHYIENWSIWRDIVILFRTVLSVCRPPASVKIAAQEHATELAPAEARLETGSV
jgi:exopolysaccharide biosynthesis polyprenyl glycosylphosphotransferase